MLSIRRCLNSSKIDNDSSCSVKVQLMSLAHAVAFCVLVNALPDILSIVQHINFFVDSGTSNTKIKGS